MRAVSLALSLLLFPSLASAQIYCSTIGQTVICQGDRGISTATEFGRRGSGQGIIIDESGGVRPYTITPPVRERGPALEPLQRLEELPRSNRYRGEYTDPMMMLMPYGTNGY